MNAALRISAATLLCWIGVPFAHAIDDAKGFGGGSLIGSWSASEEVPLDDGTTGTVSVILTFGESRFTFSAEFAGFNFDDFIPPTLLATGIYETDTSVNPNRVTITFQTLDGEPFVAMSTSIYEIMGNTLRIGGNSDESVPASFEMAENVVDYMAVGERSVCSETTVGALLDQLDTFRSMTDLPEDFDGDGVPESAIVELIRFVACSGDTKVPTRTVLSEAAQSAFLVNVSALRQAGVTDVAEVAALLGLSSNATQTEVRAALANLGFDVPPNLAIVSCDDDDCRADATLGNQVFSGGGDLDGDGMTNRQEYDASGGNVSTFLDSATDNIPGGVNGGCAASGAAAGTNVWDALLLVAVALVTAGAGRWRSETVRLD